MINTEDENLQPGQPSVGLKIDIWNSALLCKSVWQPFSAARSTAITSTSASAVLTPDPKNRPVIEQLAAPEKLGPLPDLKNIPERDMSPSWLQVWLYVLAARLFGFTFAIKLLEPRDEERAQSVYAEIAKIHPRSRSDPPRNGRRSTKRSCSACWMKNACVTSARWCLD